MYSSLKNPLTKNIFLTNDLSFENTNNNHEPDHRSSLKTLTQNIYETHQKLINLIENIDQNVQKTLEKQENEFFFAYRSHMSRVQIDLKLLKKQIEDEEILRDGNDKIIRLEKELAWFKKETENLSNKLTDKTKEAKRLRDSNQIIQSEKIFLQNKLIEVLKKKKEKKNTSSDFTIVKIGKEKEIENKSKFLIDNLTISKILTKNQEIPYVLQKYKILDEKEFVLDFEEILKNKGKQYLKKLEGMNLKIEQLKKANIFLNYEINCNLRNNNEMKSHLENCFVSVKNEIKKRKNFGALSKSDDVPFEDFRLPDKMKFLAFLLTNDSLIQHLIEKIYPKDQKNLKADGSDNEHIEVKSINCCDSKSNDLPSFLANEKKKYPENSNIDREIESYTPETVEYSRAMQNSKLKLKNYLLNQKENFLKVKTLTDRLNKSLDNKFVRRKTPLKIGNFKIKKKNSFAL